MLIDTVKSLAFFIIAGFFEIGGGYMVWLWLREGKGFEFAILGAIMLILGIFIALSVLWGWKIDNVVPDQFDIIGACIALVGVFIIMYWPRAIA